MPSPTRVKISTGSYAWSAELSQGWLSGNGSTVPDGGANGSGTQRQAIKDGGIATIEATPTQEPKGRLAEVPLPHCE